MLNTRGTIRIILDCRVVVDIEIVLTKGLIVIRWKRVFLIPGMESPSTTRIDMIKRCVPVVLAPVPVASVVVDDHVVDERIDVHQFGHLLIFP